MDMNEYTDADRLYHFHSDQDSLQKKHANVTNDKRTNGTELPDLQVFNFTLTFYNSDGKMIFNTTFDDIFDPISFVFVETINQTFRNNQRYRYTIVDNTNTYHTISGQFKNVLLQRQFDYQL